MALLRPLLRPALLTPPIILLSSPLIHARLNRPLLCETATASPSSSLQTRLASAKPPQLEPKVVRQISMGSIAGVVAGMGVSILSKPLAILLGLGFLGIQFLERSGIHIVPYSFLQRRFKNVQWKNMMQRNVAFKLSFGITFTLAAFAGF